jgi:hypothetical protein
MAERRHPVAGTDAHPLHTFALAHGWVAGRQGAGFGATARAAIGPNAAVVAGADGPD